jgi:hypothetical protein
VFKRTIAPLQCSYEDTDKNNAKQTSLIGFKLRTHLHFDFRKMHFCYNFCLINADIQSVASRRESFRIDMPMYECSNSRTADSKDAPKLHISQNGETDNLDKSRDEVYCPVDRNSKAYLRVVQFLKDKRRDVTSGRTEANI